MLIYRRGHGDDEAIAGSQSFWVCRVSQKQGLLEFFRLDFPGTVLSRLEFCDTVLINIETKNLALLAEFDCGREADIASHPIGDLRRLGFRVTVNTDNRLMSDVSMTSEMASLNEAFGWGLADLRWLTINSMKSAFLPFDERLAIIENVVKPGYAELMAETG